MIVARHTLSRRMIPLKGGEGATAVGPLLDPGTVVMIASEGPPGFVATLVPGTLEFLLIDTDDLVET
jgi:hypothetical protein